VRYSKLLALSLIVLLVAFMMVGCQPDEGAADMDADTDSGQEPATMEAVKIGHKNYTEQRLSGQMLAVLIEEHTDYPTEVIEFGGTMLCFEALDSDEIDVYPEFTGTAYGAILEQAEILSPQETYDYVKAAFEEQYGITWLGEFGWNNTYVLSVTAETAEELGVSTVSELVPYAGDMVMGCDNEFLGRADGLPGLKETYGISFKNELPMDQGLTYAALREGEIDVNVSFSTDGRIAKFNLVNLEDDKNYFPPYYVAPILKQDYADANPAVVEALLLIEGKYTDEDAQKYNLMVDEGGDPREVAEQALRDKGLIE
jgi:osmoprotectant transport system substrate-binding protein